MRLITLIGLIITRNKGRQEPGLIRINADAKLHRSINLLLTLLMVPGVNLDPRGAKRIIIF